MMSSKKTCGGYAGLSAAAGEDAVCISALLDGQDGYLTISADFSKAISVKTLNES